MILEKIGDLNNVRTGYFRGLHEHLTELDKLLWCGPRLHLLVIHWLRARWRSGANEDSKIIEKKESE